MPDLVETGHDLSLHAHIFDSFSVPKKPLTPFVSTPTISIHPQS